MIEEVFQCNHCNQIVTPFTDFYYDDLAWYIRCAHCGQLFNPLKGEDQ